MLPSVLVMRVLCADHRPFEAAAGSSSATRSAAAEQTAAFVITHPSQLPYILRKVRKSAWVNPVFPS